MEYFKTCQKPLTQVTFFDILNIDIQDLNFSFPIIESSLKKNNKIETIILTHVHVYVQTYNSTIIFVYSRQNSRAITRLGGLYVNPLESLISCL